MNFTVEVETEVKKTHGQNAQGCKFYMADQKVRN